MDNLTGKENKSRGAILKEARELQGLSLDAVHELTKVPLDVLRAIEEGYSVRTLSPFYVKAFVKKYAEFLKIDVTEIIQDYDKKQGEAVKTFQPIPEERIKKRPTGDVPSKIDPREFQRIIVRVVVVLFALFLVVKMGGCIHKRSEAQKAKKKISLQPSGTPFARQIKTRSEEAERLQEAENIPVPTKIETKKVAEVKATKANAVAASAHQREASKEPKESKEPKAPVKTASTKNANMTPVAEAADQNTKNKPILLTIKAKKNGWLQVKVDGNLVFQSTISTGDSESWEAKDSIEISGKNIFFLDFEVNGKVLGSLGRSDRSARRVVITHEGLSVKQ